MLVCKAGGATDTAFVCGTIAIVVDVVAVIVVGTGFGALSPGGSGTEVGGARALAGLAGFCAGASVEPILVGCIAVAFVVHIATVVEFALMVEAVFKAFLLGATRGG